MSSIPVYTGRWHDYSRNSVYDDVLTLHVREGGYLIAALSTFVGFVGTALWSLIAFIIHQCRAKSGKEDGLYFQHQVLYRNAGSPFGVVWDILMICYAWRKSGNSTRVRRLKIRSLLISFPPIIVFATFTTAGIFVSDVAGKSYRSNDVLVKAGKCGISEFDASVDGLRALFQKIANDTLAARAYASSCYGSATTLAECSLYPSQSLIYVPTQVPCPFSTDPEGANLCLFGQNNALQLDTGLMDTSDLLGINAPKHNRLQVSKILTCSPLNTSYYQVKDSPEDPVYQFDLGPILTYSGNLTYSYPTHTQLDDVGYQITSVYAGNGTWQPVQALQVANGDLSAFFFAANSVVYLQPVEDIWFSATTRIMEAPVPGQIDVFYGPNEFVNVMGCVEQYQICNPNINGACTETFGLQGLHAAIRDIGLNAYQFATALRLYEVFVQTTTYNAVNSLGDTALLARNRLVGLVSTGLPSNQWQIEVQGWFETTLAQIQAYVVEYAANTADLGPYGNVTIPTFSDNLEQEAFVSFCSEQRVRNIGGYQTFSILGLLIVICIGIFTILLSWTCEPIVGWLRKHSKTKHDYREISRIADRKLQLQRIALRGAGFGEGWDNLLDAVPVTTGEKMFPFPTRCKVDDEEDYQYSAGESLLRRASQVHSLVDAQEPGPIPEEHPSWPADTAPPQQNPLPGDVPAEGNPG